MSPGVGPPETSFRFRYTVFVVDARVEGDKLVSKTGLKMVVVPLERLQLLYVHAPREREHQELVLCYRGRKDRLKRARIFADRDEPGFTALIDFLLARRPEIDLRGVPAEEAFRRMGAVEASHVVLPLIMGLGWLMLALFFGPLIIHGLDTAPRLSTTVQALAEHGPPVGTRNLRVQGRIAPEQGWRSVTKVDQRLGSISVWLPLVGPKWAPEDEVDVILYGRGLTDEDVAALPGLRSFDGVLRTVWWEGLGASARKGLIEGGARLSPQRVLVLDYGARPRDDLKLSLGILGLIGAMVLATTILLWRRR